MKLATLRNGTKDGQLVVISKDGKRYTAGGSSDVTLQSVMDNWAAVSGQLEDLSTALNAGDIEGTPVNPKDLDAPLPRAWQWLDGSVYQSHAHLMDKLLGNEPKVMEKPFMYQGVSSKFYSATDDIPFQSEDDNIDFEGEFGIIVDDVPMGVTPGEARQHIKLIVQINDWSLRKYAGPEMALGFGWIVAKPPCSMAPFALTPDELGEFWDKQQVQLKLNVKWNGDQFGNAHGGHMAVGFDALVAHAASTRELVAGTVIGSGTVSNENYREVGSACIAERRGIEVIDTGAPKTRFMNFGDTVRMEARTPNDEVVFGPIDQKIVKYSR
jgi:fumarylacetoacetate (FAA) hydrolase